VNASIQPTTTISTFTCSSCGATYELRSTVSGQALDVCANCHPAYTGRERAVATGSRIEQFEQRLAKGRRLARASA
jgi:large subunit ribosomal protein L31